MFAVTMETATEGVEASLSGLVHKSAHRFWIVGIKIPFIARSLLRDSRSLNQDLAASNIRLLEILRTIPLEMDQPLDAEMHMRDRLERIKQSSLQFRDRFQAMIRSKMSDTALNRRLKEEWAKSEALCCEAFELANRFQWALAEHDADYAARHDGFVASSAAELDAMLERL